MEQKMFGIGDIRRMNSVVPSPRAEHKYRRQVYSNVDVVTQECGARVWLSYGYYPIIIQDKDGDTVVNTDKVSPTTSRQTSKVLRDLGYPSNVTYMDSKSIGAVYRNMGF